MAFTNTPNEGVPFYRGVAPIVPEPSDTAAKIISAGTATGVSAFVQMALGAQRAQLAQQELLQRADIAANQLQFQRDHMADAHGLALSAQGLQQTSIDNALWYQSEQVRMEQGQQESIINNKDAMSNYYNTQSNLTDLGITSMVQNAEKQAKYVLEAGQTAQQLDLEGDPGPNPALYGKNAIGFEKLYGSSIDPMIQKKVKEYMAKAEASKARLKDETGATTEYPWIQVVRDIDAKGFDSPFVPMLQRSGYFEMVKGVFKTESGAEVPSTERRPKGEFKRYLEGSKQGTPFSEIEKFKSVQDPFAQSAESTMNKPIPGRKGASAGDIITHRSGDIKVATPLPEVSPVQEEADYVRAQNDADPANAAVRNARFIAAHPGMGHMIQ